MLGRYKKRRAAGQCVDCGRPSVKPKCVSCATKRYAHKREIRKLRAVKGLCTQCGQAKETPKFRMCTRCRASFKKTYDLTGKQKPARLRAKMKVYNAYGGAFCNCCGETEMVFLSVDHMNDDGASHRKTLGVVNGTGLYYWLIKNNFPPGFQILCHNCNRGRFFNGGICPHKSQAMAMFNKASETTSCLQ